MEQLKYFANSFNVFPFFLNSIRKLILSSNNFILLFWCKLYKFFGTPEFIYTKYQNNPVIIFLNWKGKWEMYLDS